MQSGCNPLLLSLCVCMAAGMPCTVQYVCLYYSVYFAVKRTLCVHAMVCGDILHATSAATAAAELQV